MKTVCFTIDGYRVAIRHVLRATSGVDLSSDSHLSNLTANLARNRKRPVSSMLGWNLASVLKSLTERSFEPVDNVPLKFLTFKLFYCSLWDQGKGVVKCMLYDRTPL